MLAKIQLEGKYKLKWHYWVFSIDLLWEIYHLIQLKCFDFLPCYSSSIDIVWSSWRVLTWPGKQFELTHKVYKIIWFLIYVPFMQVPFMQVPFIQVPFIQVLFIQVPFIQVRSYYTGFFHTGWYRLMICLLRTVKVLCLLGIYLNS